MVHLYHGALLWMVGHQDICRYFCLSSFVQPGGSDYGGNYDYDVGTTPMASVYCPHSYCHEYKLFIKDILLRVI